jgi:hypothetical protein
MRLTELEIIPEVEEGSLTRLTGRFTLKFRLILGRDHDLVSQEETIRVSPEIYELRGISSQSFQGLSRDLRFLSFEVTPPSYPELFREFPGEEGGTPSSPAMPEEEVEKDA